MVSDSIVCNIPNRINNIGHQYVSARLIADMRMLGFGVIIGIS